MFLVACQFVGFHGRISRSIFTKFGTEVTTPKVKKNSSGGGVISHHPFSYFAPKNSNFRQGGLENQYKHKQTHICFNCLLIAEVFSSYRLSGLRNAMVTSDFRPDVEIWPFSACAMKNMHYNQFSHCELGYRADATFNRTLILCHVVKHFP